MRFDKAKVHLFLNNQNSCKNTGFYKNARYEKNYSSLLSSNISSKGRTFTENEIVEHGISISALRKIKSDLYSKNEIAITGNGEIFIQQNGMVALKEKAYLKEGRKFVYENIKTWLILLTGFFTVTGLIISNISEIKSISKTNNKPQANITQQDTSKHTQPQTKK